MFGHGCLLLALRLGAIAEVASAVDCPTGDTSILDIDQYAWNEMNPEATWSPRAGIQVIDLNGAFYMLGGRTPRNSSIPGDSDIWGEVWKSVDRGLNWNRILDTNDSAHWPARAYFKAVRQGQYMYILGGQNYKLVPNNCSGPGSSNASLACSDTIDPDGPGCASGGVCVCGEAPATCGTTIQNAFQDIVVDDICMHTCGKCQSALENSSSSVGTPDCMSMVSASDFFNDVWRSMDGVNWMQMTSAAGWSPRAGLSGLSHEGSLFVMGGSINDDVAIVGGPPTRMYFNDVWKSVDGQEWSLITRNAAWSPRAGGRLVSMSGYMYMVGGEVGFLCSPQPECTPPYFNDVWRSRDGLDWELLIPAAPWAPRPGHECVVLSSTIVCFGGFGMITNPTDVFYSRNGSEWFQWGVTDAKNIKYDFDAVAVCDGATSSIYTFGGDRETFDFSDPENHLRVDNDVWRLSLDETFYPNPAPTPSPGANFGSSPDESLTSLSLSKRSPEPLLPCIGLGIVSAALAVPSLWHI